MSELVMGAAQAYVEGVYGGPTEETEKLVTLQTSVTDIIDNDPDRLALSIINVGTASAYILFSNTVSTTKGIIIQSGGGLFNVDVRNDQTLPSRAWYGVVSSGTVDLVVMATRRFATTFQEPLTNVKQRVTLDAETQNHLRVSGASPYTR